MLVAIESRKGHCEEHGLSQSRTGGACFVLPAPGGLRGRAWLDSAVISDKVSIKGFSCSQLTRKLVNLSVTFIVINSS